MSDISQLVSISSRIGRDIGLVQGGGGNTSIKSRDALMVIKASGWPLAEMNEKEGYVTLQLERVRSLFSTPSVPRLDPTQQEALLRQELAKARQGNEGIQPSLEVGLHALLGRVVIHTHPLFINVITCMESGPSWMNKVWPRLQHPPLWVPYANPGFPLASSLKQALETYRKQHASLPHQIFLENHGFCAAGGDAEEVLEWTLRTAEEARNALGEAHEKIIPPRIERISGPFHHASLAKIAERYRDVVGQDPCIGQGHHPLLHASNGHRPPMTEGILYPDAAVYCGPKVFWIDRASFTTPSSLESRLKAFLGEAGFFPRVIGVEGAQTWFVGSSFKIVEAVAEVYTIHLQARLLIERHGRPKFLQESDVRYLFEWEAERYRQEVLK